MNYTDMLMLITKIGQNHEKAFEFTRNDPKGAPEEGSEDCLYMVPGCLTVYK